ncbi:MAG: hypothetical protein HQM13_00950 [SAR324 cluster bacterium]|nr:hypothetical protein [SAR324 cluster bacterium]
MSANRKEEICAVQECGQNCSDEFKQIFEKPIDLESLDAVPTSSLGNQENPIYQEINRVYECIYRHKISLLERAEEMANGQIFDHTKRYAISMLRCEDIISEKDKFTSGLNKQYVSLKQAVDDSVKRAELVKKLQLDGDELVTVNENTWKNMSNAQKLDLNGQLNGQFIYARKVFRQASVVIFQEFFGSLAIMNVFVAYLNFQKTLLECFKEIILQRQEEDSSNSNDTASKNVGSDLKKINIVRANKIVLESAIEETERKLNEFKLEFSETHSPIFNVTGDYIRNAIHNMKVNRDNKEKAKVASEQLKINIGRLGWCIHTLSCITILHQPLLNLIENIRKTVGGLDMELYQLDLARGKIYFYAAKECQTRQKSLHSTKPLNETSDQARLGQGISEEIIQKSKISAKSWLQKAEKAFLSGMKKVKVMSQEHISLFCDYTETAQQMCLLSEELGIDKMHSKNALSRGVSNLRKLITSPQIHPSFAKRKGDRKSLASYHVLHNIRLECVILSHPLEGEEKDILAEYEKVF